MRNEVKYQVRDVESDEVLYYLVNTDVGEISLSPVSLLDLAKRNSFSNCTLFNDDLLVFKKPFEVTEEDFVRYRYSDELKEHLLSMYQTWEKGRNREVAMDIDPSIDYIIDRHDGLFKVTDILTHKEIDELNIPSFVTSLDDGTKFMKSKMNHFDGIRESKNIEKSNIFIDKYTDGVFVEIFNHDRRKVELHGLTSVLSNKEIYLNNLPSESSFICNYTLAGRLRWIKEMLFKNIKSDINLVLGRNVRVCYLPLNCTKLTSYDTTLLLNYDKKIKPTILINELKNKDSLLEFKSYISDILYGYDNLSYTVTDSEVHLKFSTEECLVNFIDSIDIAYYFLDGLEINFKLIDNSDKFSNTDELYWYLQGIKANKKEDVLFQYSFATLI